MPEILSPHLGPLGLTPVAGQEQVLPSRPVGIPHSRSRAAGDSGWPRRTNPPAGAAKTGQPPAALIIGCAAAGVVIVFLGCGIAVYFALPLLTRSAQPAVPVEEADAGPAPEAGRPGQPFDPPVQEGLVACWKLDEGRGTEAGDTLRRNPGKLVGAKWVPGKSGTALEFDGVSAYCDLGSSDSLNFKEGEDITVSAWVKTDDPDGAIFLFRNVNDGGALICLSVEGSRLVGVVREDGGEFRGPALIRGERVNDSRWHHAMLVRDTQADRISLYLDGKLQGAMPARANGAAGAITTNVRALGCERYWALRKEYSPDRQHLRGVIDEVYLYKSKLR